MAALRPYLLAAIVMAVLATGGYVWWLQEKAGQVDRIRTELRVEREQHARDLTALAAERAAADKRNAIVFAGREDVVTASASDDGPVAPVLARALRVADEIGGPR